MHSPFLKYAEVKDWTMEVDKFKKSNLKQIPQ